MSEMETPLYYKIYIDLKEQIESGKFKYGELIPTESELQQKYLVSRAPVRQALSKLENEYYIEKKQGKGTFVKYLKGQGPWYAMGGLGEDYKRDWNKQQASTLSVSYIPIDKFPGDACLFHGEERLIKIERLRYVANTPVYYMNQFLSASFDIEKIRVEKDFFNIRDLLLRLFGVSVLRIDEEVSAVSGNMQAAKTLCVAAAKPLLEIKMVAFTHTMDVAYYDIDYVNSDYWKYKTKKIQADNNVILPEMQMI